MHLDRPQLCCTRSYAITSAALDGNLCVKLPELGAAELTAASLRQAGVLAHRVCCQAHSLCCLVNRCCMGLTAALPCCCP